MSSRSSRRYQGDSPSASLTWRNASSPASGWAASANQPSITGSSVRWIAALRETPAVSALDVPQRAGRVNVAERLEPGPRRFRRQPDVLAGQPGDRLEQRPVEELLVQLP